jgi:exodeoxyribonuclease VII small subunit
MAKGFEESMKELEEIVSKLEAGDAALDESLEYFEKGIKLSKSCQKMLDTAEKKVSVLLAGSDGGLEKKNFIDEEE